MDNKNKENFRDPIGNREKYEKDKEEIKKEIEKIHDNQTESISLKELLNQDIDLNWTVEKIIPEAGFTIISGHPATFKTWLVMELAKCVATGEKFLGRFECEKGKVLIIDEENRPAEAKRRFELIGISSKAQEKIFRLGFSGIKLDSEDGVRKILDELKHRNAELLILDSLIRIHEGEENSSQDMSKLFDNFRKIQNNGVSIVATHHNRKGAPNNGNNQNLQKMRGSSDIKAAVDVQVAIEKKDENRIKIEQRKNRSLPPVKPFQLKINGGENNFSFNYAGKVEPDKTKTEQAQDEILKMLKVEEKIYQQEFIDELKDIASKNTIRKALKELTQKNKIESNYNNQEKNRKFYILKDN